MLQRILWLVLALIHLAPAFALFRPATLTELYGIAGSDPLFMLMQHRAALFAAVFSACLVAAFMPEVRRLAVIVTAISMVSFLVLYVIHESPEAYRTIALVDLVGLPILIVVAWMAWRA
ncbi:hypothetical protein [Erythrobacter sp. EC-HK427]|uniref:hypothetical protein n=1 Tax=Erythrobacter sp. EC-HK427 TaxID=2038396 RepID=UPI001252C749|nr:hypothetical protein [Erythrobacter sp. EC-HK427]VVT19110.1 conserved membrane hypothetical protein [Erythrobacter sp. EC-HK427]